jgi:hypothetical protein
VPHRLALGKDFFKILCRVPHDLALGKLFFFVFLPHFEYFKFFDSITVARPLNKWAKNKKILPSARS